MPASSPVFLLFVMGYLLLSSLVGGGILRMAVQLHNRFAVDMRYDGVIEVPSFGSAIGMMLAINFIMLIVSAFVQVYLQASGLALQSSAGLGASAILFGITIVITAWLVSVSLGAPWNRAFVIACIHTFISVMLALVTVGTLAFMWLSM